MKRRRQRRGLGDGNVCARVHFKDESPPGDYEINVTAWDGGTKLGEIIATRRHAYASGRRGSEQIAKVGWVKVLPAAERRCGLGTKLYEKALTIACRMGLILASDWQRTEASESFWRKQERKGRAICASTEEVGTHLNEEMGDVGEWPCYYYQMTEACPKNMSLAGLRKKKPKGRSWPKWRRRR